jgi:hypothetical protein
MSKFLELFLRGTTSPHPVRIYVLFQKFALTRDIQSCHLHNGKRDFRICFLVSKDLLEIVKKT